MQHLSARFDGDPHALARLLAPLRPLVPRPLLRSRLVDRLRLARALPGPARSDARDAPIKGTRPAGEDVDDPKDDAEHTMIVDLERNDLARVCEPGSIRWPELRHQ